MVMVVFLRHMLRRRLSPRLSIPCIRKQLLSQASRRMMSGLGSQCDVLRQLQDDYFQWRLLDAPEFASSHDFHQYDDQVEDFSLEVLETRKVVVDSFLERALAISELHLHECDRYNLRILQDALLTMSSGYPWRHHGNLNPVNFLEGKQCEPEREIEPYKFDKLADFYNYISRLNERPQQLDQFINRFRLAVELGRTLHKVSIEPVIGQIQRLLVNNPEDSIFYKPFQKMLDNLTISNAEKEELRKKGRTVVDSYLQAYAGLQQYLRDEYMAHTREKYSVSSWSKGDLYYRRCLEWHLTTRMDPEEIFHYGLSEVARISALVRKIMKKQNFTGTLAEYFEFLRNDPRFYLTSTEKLQEKFEEIIDRVYPKLPLVFKNVPSSKPRVMPMMYEGPGGEYHPGTRDGRRKGTFSFNALHPNETNVFSMVALTLHETVPGHHLQHEFSQMANLPDFRANVWVQKYFAVPYNYPFYTAYIEGWALYAEYLGEELGLYEDDYELVGRYGEELLRACRLVVDPGLHYRGWSRDQAIQYLLEHLMLSYNEIATEVDRYLTWPGQACAYKFGEMKIKELRENAQNALGDKFDLREFHWTVLKNGPVPLSILETMVTEWVANELSAKQPPG